MTLLSPTTVPIHRTPGKGSLTVVEAKYSWFSPIERIYWIIAPSDFWRLGWITRGKHAHHATTQVFFCLRGEVLMVCEPLHGRPLNYSLSGEHPEEGVIIPPLCWHRMDMRKGSILLVLADSEYDEKDYIRSRDEWEHLRQP